MSLTVEKLEGSMAKLTIEIAPEEVEKAITKAYNKIKYQVSLPGFRKGKVPQKMIERAYGVEVFYEDAANIMINDTYRDEAKGCEYEIVSQPQIDVEQLERGKSFIYTAIVAIRPEVTLGEYKGLEYTKKEISVTDEDVTKELESEQRRNSRQVPVTDRPAQNEDIVDISYDGYVNGKAFDGGKAEHHMLTLGSGSFIDNFEEQIEGHNPGDEFDVNVTFPQTYHEKSLQGKQALFKVKLNEIKKEELPALDDEFASEVSEFETLDEYKASIRTKLEEKKANEAKEDAKAELIEKAIANAEMTIPEPMIQEHAEVAAQNFQMNLQQSGLDMRQYLQMLGMTPQTFLEQQKPYALKNIQGRLLLEAIAKAEGLEATEEDIEEQYRQMADAYQMDIEKIKEAISDEEKEDLKVDIAVNKSANFLFDNAVAVEPKAAEEAPAEEAPAEKEE